MLDCGCHGDAGWAVDAGGVGRRGVGAMQEGFYGGAGKEADEADEKVGRGADPSVLREEDLAWWLAFATYFLCSSVWFDIPPESDGKHETHLVCLFGEDIWERDGWMDASTSICGV